MRPLPPPLPGNCLDQIAGDAAEEGPGRLQPGDDVLQLLASTGAAMSLCGSDAQGRSPLPPRSALGLWCQWPATGAEQECWPVPFWSPNGRPAEDHRNSLPFLHRRDRPVPDAIRSPACPSLCISGNLATRLSGRPAGWVSVRMTLSTGVFPVPVNGYFQCFQDGPGHLGKCGAGVHQGFQLLESLAVLVAYLNRYLESSHSCPLHLRELHGWVVAEPAVLGAKALLLRGLGLGAIRYARILLFVLVPIHCAKPPYYRPLIAFRTL